MTRGKWSAAMAGAVLMAGIGLAAPAEASVDEATAYVWANNQSAASYNPSAAYAFNSAGGATTIYRSGPGVYSVILEDAATTGGVVHVQTYGSNARIACTVAGWGPTILPPGDLQILVRCFTSPNTPTDSRFVVSFTNAELGGTGRFSYLWTDQANPVGLRTLTHVYKYDSQGGPISYERLTLGVYRVHLPPNPAGLGPVFPMVHVTPYATEWIACQIGYPDQLIVSCSRADGDPVDTRFTLTYGKRVDLTGHTTGGFGSGVLYEDTISSGVINGDSYVSGYPAGGGMSATVSGIGSYVMTLRGVGGSGGHATVTAVGEMDWDVPPRGKWSGVSWWQSGVDEKVQVDCHAFGLGFADRDLNVRVTFTRYLPPV